MFPSKRSLTGKNLLPRGSNSFPLEKACFKKGIDVQEQIRNKICDRAAVVKCRVEDVKREPVHRCSAAYLPPLDWLQHPATKYFSHNSV